METEPKNPRTDTVDDGRDFLAHISATDKLLSEIPGVDWTWRGREKHPESQLNEGKKDEQLHNMMLFDACETERSAWWTLSVRHGLDKRRRDDIFTRAFETFCFRFSISRAASECRLEVTVVGRGASLSCMLEAMKQSTCDPQEKHTHTHKIWRHKDAVEEPARQDLSAEKLRDIKFLSILSEPFLWTIMDGTS